MCMTMPAPEGEKIATWRHEQINVDNEDLEYGFVHTDELYFTPKGLVERRGLLYYQAGAPHCPKICDDHTRDVSSVELDGLVKKYSLPDETVQRIRRTFDTLWEV